MRIEGYVILSANGMLADANHVMPPKLKFDGDQQFFNDALDNADLVVHGRNSGEEQPNSPKRTRIVLTRSVKTLAPDPSNPKATLWNPAGAPFDAACQRAGVTSGTVAIIGGPTVFGLFLDRFDTFWLSFAPHVRIPGGEPGLPGVPARTPQQVLAAHGLHATETRVLDAVNDVNVTAWRR
ncbi:MAG: dihydrofolate reductase [Rhizobiales bacterium]|nr:dihydrofolate reductase [Hyphomicrobiales bacterium]